MSAGFGEPHHHHRITDSTNLRAKELAEAGAPSGTVVTAAEQSAGRGRGDRVWTAPADAALLYSAILRPLDLTHLLLPLAVPVAVCEACESLAPVSCRIKWPNDIWLDERKLAGVLIRRARRSGRSSGSGSTSRSTRRTSPPTCAGPRPRWGGAPRSRTCAWRWTAPSRAGSRRLPSGFSRPTASATPCAVGRSAGRAAPTRGAGRERPRESTTAATCSCGPPGASWPRSGAARSACDCGELAEEG